MGIVTIGVIADTHIPDRARHLPPAVFTVFRETQVAAILHAGDVVHPRVLQALEKIAPTYAVRGNRDIFFLRRLPTQLILEFGGVRVGITHSHGCLLHYLKEKIIHWRYGLKAEIFIQQALRDLPDTDVIIFGHTHAPMCKEIGQRLLCNPGSPTVPISKTLAPSVGIIRIDGGTARGEIVYLPTT